MINEDVYIPANLLGILDFAGLVKCNGSAGYGLCARQRRRARVVAKVDKGMLEKRRKCDALLRVSLEEALFWLIERRGWAVSIGTERETERVVEALGREHRAAMPDLKQVPAVHADGQGGRQLHRIVGHDLAHELLGCGRVERRLARQAFV